MLRVEVAGASDLARLSKQIRSTGTPKAIRKELMSGLRAGAKPAAQAAKREALSLPDRAGNTSHGTRAALARSIGVQIRTGGRTPGVLIRVRRSALGDLSAMARVTNAGKWRHPVYARDGKPRTWVTQYSRRAWFDLSVAREGKSVRAELKKVLDGIERRLSHN